MSEKISLAEFIEQVKQELREAQQAGTEPMFHLDEVNLEVSFGVEVAAEAQGKLAFFVDLSGKIEASRLHKVNLKLTPLDKTMAVYLDKTTGRHSLPQGGIALDTPMMPSVTTDLGDFNPNK